MIPPRPISAARAKAAIILGLACLASASMAAQATAADPKAAAAKPKSVAVALRISPPDALVYELGPDAKPRRLSLIPGANGSRIATLEPGRRELLIEAPGYESSRVSLAAAAGAELQAKLERSGSLLRYEGEGRTGARPKSVSFTPDGKLLVLPLLSGRGADLLDAATLERVGALEPPPSFAKAEGFVESAFFPALREIWVSQMHNSTIHVFDLDSLAYKASFPSGGSYPKVICPSADGSKAFVTNWVSEDLSVIDAATRVLLAKVKLGGTPRGLAASEDGAWLYIARFAGPGGSAKGGGAILRLRLADMRLDTLWPADGGAKRHLVLDERRGRLYATDMGRDSLFAIEAATGKLVKEVKLGPNPNACALSPDGSMIYACTRGTNGKRGYELEGPDAGELIAIDAESLEIVARQWGGDQPTGLAVSADGSRLVFTDFLDRRVEAYRAVRPAERGMR